LELETAALAKIQEQPPAQLHPAVSLKLEKQTAG